MVVLVVLVKVFASFFLGLLGYWFVGQLIDRNWSLTSKSFDTSLEKLVIPKSKFTREVLIWCHEYIRSSDVEIPSLRLNYRPYQGCLGNYSSARNEIVIHIKNIRTVRELCEVILHEYHHSRQKATGLDENYDRMGEKYGYVNNPFEVEARRVAKMNVDQCLRDIFGDLTLHN